MANVSGRMPKAWRKQILNMAWSVKVCVFQDSLQQRYNDTIVSIKMEVFVESAAKDYRISA